MIFHALSDQKHKENIWQSSNHHYFTIITTSSPSSSHRHQHIIIITSQHYYFPLSSLCALRNSVDVHCFPQISSPLFWIKFFDNVPPYNRQKPPRIIHLRLALPLQSRCSQSSHCSTSHYVIRKRRLSLSYNCTRVHFGHFEDPLSIWKSQRSSRIRRCPDKTKTRESFWQAQTHWG